MTIIKRETALGDGLYLDNRSNTYLWRGRLNRKSKTHRIRHINGRVATVSDMKKTEARRIAKDIGADAASGGGRFFAVTPAGGVTVEQAWFAYWERGAARLRSSKEKDSHWKNYIQPAWRGKALVSITKRDCADLIERRLTEARSNGEMGTAANNLQKNLKRFFSWCVDGSGYGFTGLEASPMSALRAKPVDVKLTKRKSRSLDECQLCWFFQAMEVYATTITPCERAESKRRVRRQNIWLRSRRRLAECRPRLGVDVRRRACGVASADVRWSVA